MVSAVSSVGIPNASTISVMEPRTMAASDTGKFAMVKGCSPRNCREFGQCGEQSSLRGVGAGRKFDQDGRVVLDVVNKFGIGLELVECPGRGKLAPLLGQLLRIE